MHKGILQRLGEWCARHAIIVIVVWLAGLGVLHGLQNSFGGTYSDDFSLPDSQSQKGADVLQANAPTIGGTSAQVVLHDAKPLTDFTTQVNQAVASLQKLDHVLSVQNPLPQTNSSGTTTQTGALSKDGTIGYITVRFDQNPSALGTDYLNGVDAAVAPLRSAGVQVEYGGPLGEAARPHTKDLTSEAIGFAVAIVVLIVGFGSLIAAGLPLVTALISVIVGLSCLSLLAAAIDFASVSPTLATMIGLGVGIDYALFLITRYRQLIMDRVEPHIAAGVAVTTSGRAVLVSGCTVIVALAGLYVSGLSFIGRLGIAAAVTVVTAVAGALTLVPALAGLIGRRIDRFCLKTPVAEGGPVAGEDAGKKSGEQQHGFWHRYAKRVEHRPWWFLAAGVLVLGILAIPLFSMRLDHIDDGADPTSFTDRRAFDLISQGFGPGANGPLTLVVDQTNVPSSQRSTLASNLQKALTGVPNAASISPLQATSNGNVLTGTAISTQRPQAADTTHLFNHLKDVSLPQGAKGTAATTYVTGVTAAQQDFTEIISSRLALIIVVVVCLAFLIILAVFRGLLVAVKAAVLNLFSIGASYGVVVAVFQWGWGGSALGVAGKVPIESYVPMMMFAIIFGLSMDYEIFLLSRVHEAWIRTQRAEDSVAYGLEITARVITCAALIMFSVFAAFILSDNIVVKMLGLGLAVSVLVDATVVRLLLVPAVMTLLGRHAWWAPRWLDRILPHLDTEGESALHQAMSEPASKR
ncbi:MMPL family transporter [Streptacidiphilus jiangxiensis]|uniref:Putative drug exporter of the RND superfamily n=1 Tax=Streptacidiphilus jiangxiensis TaxID=235985 RepID=A0A1H7SNJ9_STRJI|nr:MMPL family transporter [Streptacidiphilus jiangxiensis]SEL73047.1 putative drug exporter of the RND superfamily [Streptacidiphilus jiangxiensis]